MASVQSTNNDSTAAAYAALNGKSASKTATTTQEAQDRFLTLLVTQLKNQDPLNPLDNAQVTTQLAQINTVTGIEKLNTTLSNMMAVYDQSQSMQAAAMIGKHVLVPGSSLPLASGTAVAGVQLDSAAEKVMVSVLDKAGNTVYEQDLGSRKAGSFAFAWDGVTNSGTQAADGNYVLKVAASSAGKSVTATALQLGTVGAVVRTSSGFTLDLGSAGNVAYADVKQIL